MKGFIKKEKSVKARVLAEHKGASKAQRHWLVNFQTIKHGLMMSQERSDRNRAWVGPRAPA